MEKLLQVYHKNKAQLEQSHPSNLHLRKCKLIFFNNFIFGILDLATLAFNGINSLLTLMPSKFEFSLLKFYFN